MPGKTGKRTAVALTFKRELDDTGTAKVTSGRKHRYKEEVNMELGMGICIGTIYLAEHVVMGPMGNPDQFTLNIEVPS